MLLTGLSPRGQGKLYQRAFHPGSGRSIPAWAGETCHGGRQDCPLPVYPRVGGGNQGRQATTPTFLGLSPRGRGKPWGGSMSKASSRSIPAWAGETTTFSRCNSSATVYPRVGGGNAPPSKRIGHVAGLSPRGRGKRRNHVRVHRRHRSIPAWAGKTSIGLGARRPGKVYPRVGGGNFFQWFHGSR